MHANSFRQYFWKMFILCVLSIMFLKQQLFQLTENREGKVVQNMKSTRLTNGGGHKHEAIRESMYLRMSAQCREPPSSEGNRLHFCWENSDFLSPNMPVSWLNNTSFSYQKLVSTSFLVIERSLLCEMCIFLNSCVLIQRQNFWSSTNNQTSSLPRIFQFQWLAFGLLPSHLSENQADWGIIKKFVFSQVIH